jgi:hypothetical protein
MRYFAVVGDQEKHRIGAVQCPACTEGYPERCLCGGLMHAEGTGLDEQDAGIETRCDACGRTKDEIEETLGRDPR